MSRLASLAREWLETRRQERGLAAVRRSARVAREDLDRRRATVAKRTARVRRLVRRGGGAPSASLPDRTARPVAVLITYACAPGAGSEEGVGWEWARAAAEVADVVLLTSSFAAPLVQDEVKRLDLPIEVRGVEPPRALRGIATRRWGGFVYYVIWQAAAARELRDIERSRRIDAVHHVTWASDSLPSALRASSAPVRIWGPVGGSTRTPAGLRTYLSRRARFEEAVRDVMNTSFRALTGERVARHATSIVALNGDVARRFSSVGRVVIEPNCALVDERLDAVQAPDVLTTDADPSLRTALFVGRLMGWKGILLAVDALQHAPGWRLVVLGEGTERDEALAWARRTGVEDRLRLAGRVPRDEVLAAFEHADALLFPSLHDSAPWAVGEAASAGCPVVCLDVGGPALLAGPQAVVVAAEPGATCAQRLGEALESLDGRRAPAPLWAANRLPGLLEDWYRGDVHPSRRSEGDET